MKKKDLLVCKGLILMGSLVGVLGSLTMFADDAITLPRVEVDKYLGLWYEIARIPVWFEDNTPGNLSACFDVTARYDLMADGKIKVVNTCYRKEINNGDLVGEPQLQKPAIGSAVIVPGSNNSKLRVAFGPAFVQSIVRFFSSRQGNYWIYALGPVVDGKYSWALVSGPKKEYMWILSRTKTITPEVKEIIRIQAEELDLPFSKLNFVSKC